jgi:predicted methyltransferase
MSTVASLPSDAGDRRVAVFDPSIKGETDRFAYRFVKR